MSHTKAVILAIVSAYLVLGACTIVPEQQEFTVRNGSSVTLDVVFGTNKPEVSGPEHSHYSSLNIGSIDTNEWCTFCDIQPNSMAAPIFWPFTESWKYFFAARDIETRAIVYYREFSIRELKDTDWLVVITDMRP